VPQSEVVSVLRKVASFWSDAEAERQANYKLKRKAELERLPTLLAADERPIFVADCSRAGRYLGAATTDTKGLLAVTDKRILFVSNRGTSVERVGFRGGRFRLGARRNNGWRSATCAWWREEPQIQLRRAEEPGHRDRRLHRQPPLNAGSEARTLADGRRLADIKEMAGVPLGRVALALLLYPFLYVGVLAVIGRSLPSEEEGPVEVVLLAVVLIVLGFALSSWWCLVAPFLWAVVALAVGLEAPLENTDPTEGQFLIFLVLLAGLVPLGFGIAAGRFKRRSSSTT
jgi:hypothetical protein